MREFAKQFYSSKAWHRTRYLYSISQHRICEQCGDAGEIVHHIIPLNPANITNPAITLGWDNLMLLCRACHGDIHSKESELVVGRCKISFDAQGNPAPQS